ncbi:hypothetical protein M0R45_037943 [Rubus argutus]|uniref:Uncharacterized protein n=1 Tax=Rubus argutus TaxID=59490 RepID=A0AAW1W487_RUBAR
MASASSGCRRKYDVFINFRGEDTRKIFVGHLYRALKQKAINAFIDSQELRKGNHLSKILTAIQESRLSIVVFSKDYASSTWCLKELVKILQCMDTQDLIVVPVFYEVDPSHVRKLKPSFVEAFTKQEEDSNTNTEEVHSWKSALTRATNLSGWDSRNYQDDGELIEEIVADVFNKLIQTSSSKANGLVGIDSHMAEMDLLLCPGVDDVRFVGIWGMGGLGKTTIARAVYEKIACQFEHCCFLDNVKEGFTKKGEIQMRGELLSEILMEKVQSTAALNRCTDMIMEKLHKKKVLVVLDDVDDVAHIEFLLGKERSFGGGSRIILTTRDAQLLRRVDKIYKPNLLSDGEAVELFRRYAFRTNQPSGEYDNLSRCAIKYAQGLPLALKVLGAFLFDKSIREWEEALQKMKKIPHMGIHGVLKTSFDGLDDSEKDIFLDVACFFRGLDKGYVAEFLDACGFFPLSGLRVLIDRALITISYGNRIEMHDLLQEMGREVVRQESIKEPGRRSRLWTHEDVVHVLTQDTGTEAVEGIMLDLSNSKEVYINAEAFVKMRNLRLLRIHYGSSPNFTRCKLHVSGDFKFLSHELRCLIWHGYPLKSLPSNFHPKNLVRLDMPYSHLEQLWEGTEHLKRLKFINLKHSQYLNKTTDFTEATNLEELNLSSCESLLEVHSSILAHERLVFLSLSGCKKLKSLQSRIHMKSLQTLRLSGCSNLEKFPEISEVMKELVELYLDMTAIQEVPSSINNLIGLAILKLRGCRKLKILPSSIHMKSLQVLDLSGCSKLEKFPEMSEAMKELTLLFLDHTAIKELHSSIERLQGLELLSVRNYLSDRVYRRINTVLGTQIWPQWTEKVRVTSDTVPECVNDGFSWREEGAYGFSWGEGDAYQNLLLEYHGGREYRGGTEYSNLLLKYREILSYSEYEALGHVVSSIAIESHLSSPLPPANASPRLTYPRVSYACTGCRAMKTVQRSQDDPKFIEITYKGMHTCKQVPFIRSSLMISRIEPMNLEELATGLQVIINELS